MCLNMRFLSQCCTISKFHRPSFVVINIFCLSNMTNTLSATHPSAWQSCRPLFLFIYFSFSSGNHGRHVPTRCRLKKNRAATSWNPGSFAAEWLLCNIWSAHGCSCQHLESGGGKWRADERRLCFFVSLPSSVSLYGWNISKRAFFDAVDVVCLCVEAFKWPCDRHSKAVIDRLLSLSADE